MRLFVAVYPPQSALEHLESMVRRLRIGRAAASGASVGLSDRERWHVTLAFLGEVPERQSTRAAVAVRDAVARWRDGGGREPALRLAGGGRFGRRRFTVLWVGLTGDVESLRGLSGGVRRELTGARLPCDGKPLRPHLTIARPGQRLPEEDLAADLTSLAGYVGPDWPVGSVHLVRSYPGPKPVHESFATCTLAR